MSHQLQKEKYFLIFLLNTDQKQQKLLIQHLTKSQVSVITEIF